MKNSVWPSAAEPVSSRNAGMKLPPALFSTNTVVRRFSLIFCATSRAITSVAPPAASPTRTRIGLVGKSCACAAGEGASVTQARRSSAARPCIMSLRLDAVRVDELGPVRDLVLELHPERAAGRVIGLDIEPRQLLAHARA